MTNNPAEQALINASNRGDGQQTAARYLSGVTVTSPLIAAVIKWDSDDTLEATKQILESSKSLIDAVDQNTEHSPNQASPQIIELCIHTVATCWAQSGECDYKEWVQPLTEIVRNISHQPNKITNKTFSGFASVLCALSSRGIQGDDCGIFQSICKELSELCESALSKVRIIAGPSTDSDSIIYAALHSAACNLFVSTLEHEYKEHLNNSYRGAVDPNHKQTPFDMSLLMRRYRLYFDNLCEAIYANARHG